MVNQNNIAYRKDLQALRAVAITLVVLAHLGISQFKGGFIGVDVFFVLSGYLITGLLLKEFYLTQSIDFMRFYARRLRRLLPSLLLMLVLILIVTTLLVSPHELISKTKSAIYASSWTSNLYFAFSKIGYFSEMEMQDLFLHTWTLSVEEQFYLIWPLFIFTCLFIFKKYLKETNQQGLLLNSLILVFITSFILSLYWSYNQSLWAFYLMPARIWQFTLGGIIFVLFEWKQKNKSEEKNHLLSNKVPTQFIGLLLIILSAILLTPDMIYPGWWALIPSIGAALVLVRSQFSTGQILTNPVLTWIGDRSYSWYLWHWPIILLANTFGIGSSIFEAVFLAILSLLVASVSYKVVEIPFWKGRFSVLSTGKSILVSFLAMTIVVSVILQSLNTQLNTLETKKPSALNSATYDVPIIYSYGCDSWYENADINPCIYSTNTFNKTVVLIGDSILTQWFSLVADIFKAPEWRLVVLTKSSCPMVDEDYFYERIGRDYKVCSKWRNGLFNVLSTLKPDVIITGSSAFYPFTKKQWVEGSARIFSKLTDVSDKVLVIPGTPALSFDGPSCLMRISKDNQDMADLALHNSCSGIEVPPQIEMKKQYLQDATNKFENVAMLDMNDLVCPNNKCSALNKEGIIVYRDSIHLTNTFVKSLAPEIKKRIELIGIDEI